MQYKIHVSSQRPFSSSKSSILAHETTQQDESLLSPPRSTSLNAKLWPSFFLLPDTSCDSANGQGDRSLTSHIIKEMQIEMMYYFLLRLAKTKVGQSIKVIRVQRNMYPCTQWNQKLVNMVKVDNIELAIPFLGISAIECLHMWKMTSAKEIH